VNVLVKEGLFDLRGARVRVVLNHSRYQTLYLLDNVLRVRLQIKKPGRELQEQLKNQVPVDGLQVFDLQGIAFSLNVLLRIRGEVQASRLVKGVLRALIGNDLVFLATGLLLALDYWRVRFQRAAHGLQGSVDE
jgi:hypothetical protein